jgi:septum formation protein
VKIVLGSSSPRRKEILSNIIDNFDICIPQVDEDIGYGENPLDYSNRISREKVEYIREANLSNGESRLIISCDTVVTIDKMIIGKPRDYEDALKKIGILNGKTHRVISSITLSLERENTQMITGSEITEITFKNLSRDEMIQYLNSINYQDKAGAYALQENGELIIKKIRGSVTNVIGFPLRLFFRLLSALNIVALVFSPDHR